MLNIDLETKPDATLGCGTQDMLTLLEVAKDVSGLLSARRPSGDLAKQCLHCAHAFVCGEKLRGTILG